MKGVTLPVSEEFLEDVVDSLNELADDAEEAGYPSRAKEGRRMAEQLRKALVKAITAEEVK